MQRADTQPHPPPSPAVIATSSVPESPCNAEELAVGEGPAKKCRVCGDRAVDGEAHCSDCLSAMREDADELAADARREQEREYGRNEGDE